MNEEPTTFGLSRDKIIRILQIQAEKDQQEQEPASEEDKADLLEVELGRPLPCARHSGLGPSEGPTADCLARAETSPVTIGEALWSPLTPTSVLKWLKAFGRTFFSEGESERTREVGLAIYYGAIASAIVSHDVRITRLSYTELHRSFAILAEKSWVPLRLRRVFSDACACCAARGAHQG